MLSNLLHQLWIQETRVRILQLDQIIPVNWQPWEKLELWTKDWPLGPWKSWEEMFRQPSIWFTAVGMIPSKNHIMILVIPLLMLVFIPIIGSWIGKFKLIRKWLSFSYFKLEETNLFLKAMIIFLNKSVYNFTKFSKLLCKFSIMIQWYDLNQQ